jgi:hypothetical protein
MLSGVPARQPEAKGLILADNPNAKPESLYPGASTAKSMRPTESSDLRKTSTGHTSSGIAVKNRTAHDPDFAFQPALADYALLLAVSEACTESHSSSEISFTLIFRSPLRALTPSSIIVMQKEQATARVSAPVARASTARS